MARLSSFAYAFLGLAALTTPALAAVTPSTSSDLTTFGTPTPTTRTYANPGVPDATAGTRVAENLSTNRLLSQTFRVSTNITLDKVAIRVGGTGDGTQSYQLHLYDITGGSSLGGSYRPSTDGPTGLKGVELLPTTPSFTYTNSTGNDVLLTLDLTGSDEVALTANDQYAFELWPVASFAPSQMNWIRGSGGISTYPNGDGYEDTGGKDNTTLRTQLTGSSRDLVFAAYAAVPEPTSLVAVSAVVGGLVRRRRA